MLNWLRSLLTDAVKTALLAVLAAVTPPVAVIWAKGLDFISISHPVAGWLILVGAGAAGLFLSSVALNFAQWRRSASRRRTLLLVAEGSPVALWWHMGSNVGGPTPVPFMQVVGDFHVTNVSPFNVTVPRSILVVSHKVWGVIPWRTRVNGFGISQTVLKSHHLFRERLGWSIEPPLLKIGQVLHARPGLIDNFGRTNWGEWVDFKYT